MSEKMVQSVMHAFLHNPRSNEEEVQVKWKRLRAGYA
jgi:hypothetical protein